MQVRRYFVQSFMPISEVCAKKMLTKMILYPSSDEEKSLQLTNIFVLINALLSIYAHDQLILFY